MDVDTSQNEFQLLEFICGRKIIPIGIYNNQNSLRLFSRLACDTEREVVDCVAWNHTFNHRKCTTLIYCWPTENKAYNLGIKINIFERIHKDCWWQLSSHVNLRFMLTASRKRPPSHRVATWGNWYVRVRVAFSTLLARVSVRLELGLLSGHLARVQRYSWVG
jgi:hypothetical protein